VRNLLDLLNFSTKEERLKKLVILTALLAMLLTAFAPLVLAQQAPLSDVPAEPSDDATEPSDVTTDPTDAPTAGPVVGCQELYDDPAAFCIVDVDGFVTLPDGSQAPVLVRPNGTAYVQNTDGSLTLIGEGASFIVDEDPASDIQYDDAQGETTVPEAPVAGEQ
jgi:hypothetical protein